MKYFKNLSLLLLGFCFSLSEWRKWFLFYHTHTTTELSCRLISFSNCTWPFALIRYRHASWIVSLVITFCNQNKLTGYAHMSNQMDSFNHICDEIWSYLTSVSQIGTLLFLENFTCPGFVPFVFTAIQDCAISVSATALWRVSRDVCPAWYANA